MSARWYLAIKQKPGHTARGWRIMTRGISTIQVGYSRILHADLYQSLRGNSKNSLKEHLYLNFCRENKPFFFDSVNSIFEVFSLHN